MCSVLSAIKYSRRIKITNHEIEQQNIMWERWRDIYFALGKEIIIKKTWGIEIRTRLSKNGSVIGRNCSERCIELSWVIDFEPIVNNEQKWWSVYDSISRPVHEWITGVFFEFGLKFQLLTKKYFNQLDLILWRNSSFLGLIHSKLTGRLYLH